MSRVLLLAFLAGAFISHAQRPDTSFRLLWYKGKKINDTVLLMPSGGRVSYSPSSGSVGVTVPDAKNPLLPLIKSIKKTEQRKEQVDELIIKSSKGIPYLNIVAAVNRSVDQVKAETAALLVNEIRLPNKAPDNTTDAENRPPDLVEGWHKLPTWVENAYEELKAYIARQEEELKNFDPPPPPDFEYDYCYPCDSARQQEYQRKSDEYMRNYLPKEYAYLEVAQSIIRYFTDSRLKGRPYDTVLAKRMVPELISLTFDILGKAEKKLKAVWLKYRDDPMKAPFFMNQFLGLIRSHSLVGLEPGPDLPSLDEISEHALNASVKYFAKAIKDKNYPVMLNVSGIAYIFNKAESMKMTESLALDRPITLYIMNSVFKVTVNADATAAKDGVVMGAKMTGKNYFVAAPDENCHLRWELSGPDPKEMTFTLENPKFKTPDGDASYIGTTTWASGKPVFKLDFCDGEKRDSAMFRLFFPRNGKEDWEVQGKAGQASIVQAVFLTCLIDKERMEELANDPALLEDMKRKMMEKQKELEKMSKNIKDPSHMSAKDMEDMRKLMNAGQDMTEITGSLSFFLIKGHLVNFNEVVFDHTLDGKQLFPENPYIQNALFRVEIQHIDTKTLAGK